MNLQYLELELSGKVILIVSNNTATVSYINKQGGVVSRIFNVEAYTLYHWTIPQDVQMMVIH